MKDAINTEWDFTTLALLWDPRTGAVLAGADRLEALEESDLQRCARALVDRVFDVAGDLDDGSLLAAAMIMAEDLYKTLFGEFRWTAGVAGYLAGTAGTLMLVLARRGLVMHYVVNATQPEHNLAVLLEYLPLVFGTAGLAVTGPQLMALDSARRFGCDIDATVIQRYRDLGNALADLQITRCHTDRRSSAYFNVDLDDGLPALSMDSALAARNAAGTLVVFRDQPPTEDSTAAVFAPAGVNVPRSDPLTRT